MKQQTSGKWNSIHGAVQEKYGQITDDELREVEGDSEQLIGLIQQKVGAAREEVESFVTRIYQECGESCSHLTSRASEYAEVTGEKLRQGYERSTKAVARHPMESVATALGIGILAGIAIGYSLATDRYREPTWRERWSGR
ncbi:CsbD family protein [Rubripirellula amarantea]|nr:CsbD family protein [Rubripirellula amarantea]